MSVNNGGQVFVELPEYSGKAGFTVRGAMAELSYFTDAKAGAKTQQIVGDVIKVAGGKWTVTEAKLSPYRRGVRTLILRRET